MKSQVFLIKRLSVIREPLPLRLRHPGLPRLRRPHPLQDLETAPGTLPSSLLHTLLKF